MKKVITSYYYFLPLVVLCVFYLCKSYFFPIHDFGNYYFASLLYRLNEFSTEVYAPAYYNTAVHEMGYEFMGTYLPFTPITTLFFYPFTFLEPSVAKFIFSSISIFLFINTLRRVFIFLKIDTRYLLLFPILFYVPIKNGILFGQFYMVLFVLITETLLFYANDKKWYSALFLSIAIAIKIVPIVFIFWFISVKDWKQVVRVISVGTILLGISIFLNGISIWQFYIINILQPSLDGVMGLDFQVNYQSISIFLKYVFVEDSYFNPNPTFNNYALYHYVLIFSKSLILSLGILMTYVVKNKNVRFGLWIFILFLLSPNGSTYSLILLALPLVVILSDESMSLAKKVISIIFIVLISNVPWNLFTTQLLVFKFIRLVLLVSFFSILITWYFIKVPHYKFALIFGCILALQLLKPISIPQKGDTIYGGKSIISNFELQDGNLLIEEVTIDGKIKKTIKKIEFEESNDNVTIKKNKLYVNNVLITDTKDHKLNPKIVNGKIFFLSDYNQGYKFYNLRSISIPRK